MYEYIITTKAWKLLQFSPLKSILFKGTFFGMLYCYGSVWVVAWWKF